LRIFRFVALFGSAYFTIALGFERHLAVYRPLHVKSIATFRRACILASLITVFAIVCQIPLLIVQLCDTRKLDLVSNYECLALYKLVTRKKDTVWIVFLGTYFIFLLLVPIVLVSFFNARIVLKVRISFVYHSLKFLKNHKKVFFVLQIRKESKHRPKANLKSVTKTSKLLWVLIFYLISLFVRVIVLFVMSVLSNSYAELNTLVPLNETLNSSVNFIIYLITWKAFRVSCLKLFRRFHCCA